MKNRTIILLLIFCQASMIYASETDTIKNTSLGTIELMPILNPWLNTSNPAGHFFNPDINPGLLSLNYTHEKGDFKPIMRGDQMKNYSMFTERYLKIKKTSFYGSFAYNKDFEHGTKYTLLNNVYRGTPYILIDTTGRYDINDRESFTIRGDISSPIYKNLSWGLSVKINSGLSTQDRDPRPRNKITNIDLSQGLLLSYPKLSLGANILYAYYNEDIEVEIIERNTQATFLQVHSFDAYTYHIAGSFYRLYKRNTLGGEAQANYKNGGLNTLFAGKFLYFDESSDDGRKAGDGSWSYIKNDSELMGNEFEVFNATTFRKNSTLHSFYAKAWSCNMLGAEFLQRLEQIGETDAVDWIDYGSEEKYASSMYQIEFTYSFLLLKNTYLKDMEVSLGLNYFGSSRAYYLPDMNDSYDGRIIAADIEKTFRKNKHEFALGAGVKMKKILSSSKQYDETSFISQNILLPDFAYFTSDFIAPSVNCTYAISMNKLFDKIYLKSNVSYYKGDEGINRTIVNFSTGVIFKN